MPFIPPPVPREVIEKMKREGTYEQWYHDERQRLERWSRHYKTKALNSFVWFTVTMMLGICFFVLIQVTK